MSSDSTLDMASWALSGEWWSGEERTPYNFKQRLRGTAPLFRMATAAGPARTNPIILLTKSSACANRGTERPRQPGRRFVVNA